MTAWASACVAAGLGAAVLLGSCAAPPLVLHTLDAPGAGPGASALGRKALVVEVARIGLPDELDTQDIQVRHGSVLQASHHGRWASRLSVGATRVLTARLARRRPDALVTDQQQAETPSYRIVVNISRLDVTADGAAVLEADWQVVPGNPALPARRDRTSLRVTGPVATDGDVVAMVRAVLEQLADRIGTAAPR